MAADSAAHADAAGTPRGPTICVAVMLLRADGRTLLVRHHARDARFPALWLPPLDAVADDDVAEAAADRLLRTRLHVTPGPVEFAETLYLPGADGGRYVVNVFTCDLWSSDPRFSADDYDDAAWVEPGAVPVSFELPPELRRWLDEGFATRGLALDRAAIVRELEDARAALVQALEAIPGSERTQQLSGEWSPLDVLALASGTEAYLCAEARRLLETPGYTWQPFHEAQWEADHRSRPRETEAELRARLAVVARGTVAWLATLDAERLGAYGNHPDGGVVTVGDRLREIARAHRALAGRLNGLAQAARLRAGAGRASGRA